MKNKIDATSFSIHFFKGIGKGKKGRYTARIEYKLGDERNEKSHPFDTFEEAYQWIKNQVFIAD